MSEQRRPISIKIKLISIFAVALILQCLWFLTIREDAWRASHLFLCLGSLLILLPVGFWMVYRLLNPMDHFVQALRGIEKGPINQRIAVLESRSEFFEIEQNVNSLLDRLEKLVHRLKGAVELLAHDIRNPVTNLRARAEHALSENTIEGYQEALSSCYMNSERILRLIDDLSDVALIEGRDFLRSERRVRDLIEEILNLYEIAFEEKKIQIHTNFSSDDLVCVNPNLFRRVFANILDNAYKFSKDGGEVWIHTASTEYLGTKSIQVLIGDNGRGIPEKDLPNIWKKNYRGGNSKEEKGMGLGLSFVRSIVEAHGGEIHATSPWVDMATGKMMPGTLMTLYLPESRIYIPR